MHTDIFRALRHALPIALAVAALTLMHQAPARADSSPQEQACGSVDLNTTSSADATLAFNCFSGAFASCKPAALQANSQDANASTRYTFETVDGGDDHGCSISEVVEKQSGGQKSTDTYLCRTVSRDKDGTLRFGGCGAAGDVALHCSTAVTAATPAANQGAPKN